MCCCHRANASVECSYEIGHRSILDCSLGNNGADGGAGILDTMVELSSQYAVSLLCALALSHVDVDAYRSMSTVFIVRNRTASLDPTDLTGWPHDSVLSVIVLTAIGNR